MHQRKIPLYAGCGYSFTMQIIGGKWKICIIDALRDGPLRPSELFKAIPDATERVINQKIKELLNHKIINRTIYAQQPPRSEYFLTELGRSVFPLIDSLDDWGEKNRAVYEDVNPENISR